MTPFRPVVSFIASVSATFSLSGAPAVADAVRLTLTSSSSSSLLRAYDPNGLFLGSMFGGASSTLSVGFPGQIHSVILSGGPFAFDNFAFEGLAIVPEPTSLSLLSGGLVIWLACVRPNRAKGIREASKSN